MKFFKTTKQLLFISSCLILVSIFGCKKSTSSEHDLGFGCNTNTVLKTVANVNGNLVYSSGQSQWVVFIDFPGGGGAACDFCDQSLVNAMTNGHSLSDVINVTISGDIKRRLENQIPPSAVTSYPDIYLISATSLN